MELIKYSLLTAFLAVCSHKASAQQLISDSLLHDEIYRHYQVFLPSDYDAEASDATVLVLHGGSGNAQSIQGFTGMNFFANQHGFIAVYPQGAGIAPPGFSWADGRGTTADDAGIDDIGFMHALLDTLQLAYNADPDSLYATGFSNGGFMTQRMACEMNDRFAAIGAVGCSMDTSLYANCTPANPLGMLMMVGTNDPEIPYEGGEMTNPAVNPIVGVEDAFTFWVDALECSAEVIENEVPDFNTEDNSTVEFTLHPDCTCDQTAVLYRIINGGHTWPGVELPDLEDLLGETNEDIHASDIQLLFFKEHARCTETDVKEQKTNLFTVYPNPAAQFLDWKAPRGINRVRLVNLRGTTMIDAKATDTNRMDISELSSGLYLIQFMQGNQVVASNRVVVDN